MYSLVNESAIINVVQSVDTMKTYQWELTVLAMRLGHGEEPCVFSKDVKSKNSKENRETNTGKGYLSQTRIY